MGLLGRVLLALMVLFGSAGLESGAAPKACCSCCETTVPEEPCGCGMPQQSNSQRCGGNQAPASTALAQPKAAISAISQANPDAPGEATPCPARLIMSIGGHEAERLPAQAFGPQEGPPRSALERQAMLRLFRI